MNGKIGNKTALPERWSDNMADGKDIEKQICSECETGRNSYKYDKHSEVCPYLNCWKDNKCPFYIPAEQTGI